MKDLYTFDYSTDLALQTYEDVRKAYSQLFIDEMKLPVLVAKASSGDMGGSLSHEYHIPTPLGDDHIISCNSCDYIANEEVASSRTSEPPETGDPESFKVWRAITKDRKKFINVFYKSEDEISTHAVKKIIPDFDPSVVDAMALWSATLTTTLQRVSLVTVFDRTVPRSVRTEIIRSQDRIIPAELSEYKGRVAYVRDLHVPHDMSFLRIKDGDGCPRCKDGKVTVQKAIELGHTFHLGTRYSEPMNAFVTGPKRLLLGRSATGKSSEEVSPSQAASEPGALDATTPPAADGSTLPTSAPEYPPNENTQALMQMGCHGIGISRIIGAVADHFVDEQGLNWPRAIAPYEVVIIYNAKDEAIAGDAATLYDALSQQSQPQSQPGLDAILDDREALSLGWKLRDGDLVGYPVIVIVGREWRVSRRVEVQCRRLGFKESVAMEELRSRVEDLLQQL